MEKSEFLERLKSRLNSLPDDEVQEIVADYEEHFAAGVEAGRTEAAIAAALGDPDELGKQLLAASHIETAERTGSFSALCRAALATLGLGLFNFCIALVPIVVVASIIFAIFMTGVSLVFGGIVALVVTAVPAAIPAGMTVVMPFETPLARVATAVGLIALGLLVSVGSIYPARSFVRAMARYAGMNLSVVRRAYGNER
ncbi:DUF1700 domain-containing protein [Methanofollis formosanus]|uniref:DUF1700 domain-containing protein n=1 Tax=Methanofollis formosanus TaxID=299308 RepID=A0A8G0ZWR7_9EURY|nr:DUF1700 domain-containing protein [Methanofollis formosanus]QYZ78139.1 DUF1700 domain-containing protein [Methanofollis formosanus]